jgi:hypothetical protein
VNTLDELKARMITAAIANVIKDVTLRLARTWTVGGMNAGLQMVLAVKCEAFNNYPTCV